MLATPVRSQLSALIFAKCLRMKVIAVDNVVGQRTNAEDRPPFLKSNVNADGTHERSPLLPEANEEETKEESATEGNDADSITNGIVNLLGVDVQRVADFCGYNVDLLRGGVKALSTLVGFAVPVLMQPILGIATKRYTSLQLSIMGARDNKAHVVEEALHGIRQIKFSAIEAQWERLILAARERELLAQRNVYIWGIVLTFIWLTMPTMIGTAAISVYAWLSQNMKPSVAFTALSAFSSLEWTINVIPTTITEMLDARVSINRIQQHLEAEEEISALKSGDTVELEDATVAWPCKARSPSDFSISNLNLSFPPISLRFVVS
nr:atp-dependent bile acid permease [Quercus suber]